METRKIQKVGGSTFTVSVPKEWARRQGLDTGESVRLYTHRDGSLIVRGRQTDGESLDSVSLSVTGSRADVVERSIEAAYEAGHERITLVADDQFTDEQRRRARTVARRLVGTELLDADAGEIEVQAMLDASAVSIRQSIDQTVSIVSTMQEMVRENMIGDSTTTGQVGDRMTDVTRLVALIRRHYNRSLVTFRELDALGIDRVALSQHYQSADRLEAIARVTVHLSEAIEESTLEDSDREALAERIAELRAALEETTKPVVEGTDVPAVALGSPSIDDRSVAIEDGGPSTTRLYAHLRHVEDAIRAIERIGHRSAVHPGQPQ